MKASEGLQEGPSRGGGVTQEPWLHHLRVRARLPARDRTVSPCQAFPTLPGVSLPCPPRCPAWLPGLELVVSSLESSAWAHLQHLPRPGVQSDRSFFSGCYRASRTPP